MIEKTKYQTSNNVDVKRSSINFANYNPRKITKEAKISLKKNIKRIGLLGGIVVNIRSNNLVSGHQRLSVLDSIEGYDKDNSKDYLLSVEIIDVDEATEKEQNIFMNSSSVQGEFDMIQLSDLLKDIDYSNAGLTDTDMALLGIELDICNSEEIGELDSLSKKEAIKDLKKSIREKIDNNFEEGDPLLVLSFSSFDAKAKFMDRFGFDIYEKFIKGEIFENMIERV
jgi:hypothetical protein